MIMNFEIIIFALTPLSYKLVRCTSTAVWVLWLFLSDFIEAKLNSDCFFMYISSFLPGHFIILNFPTLGDFFFYQSFG